jgi:prepilin-type N-terminal cleavage/methylation domain-containing protein
MQSKTIKRLGWKTPTSAGFTLVELIVSIFAFAILAMGVIALTSNVLTSADSQGRALANVDLARKTSFEIISGLRAAAYSDSGAYPLQEVSALTLTFYTNFDGGSDNHPFCYCTKQCGLPSFNKEWEAVINLLLKTIID